MRQRYDRAKTLQPALFSALLTRPAFFRWQRDSIITISSQYHHNFFVKMLRRYCNDARFHCLLKDKNPDISRFLRLFGHPSIITIFCNDAVKML